MGVAGEGIDERESGKFEEGLDSKVKLSLYRTFGKIVEFKKYLRGVGDAGTRLLFKFRSGTHGLNEELGRHRGREGMDWSCRSDIPFLMEVGSLGTTRILCSRPAGIVTSCRTQHPL